MTITKKIRIFIIEERTAVPSRVPESCGPQWCESEVFFHWRDLQRYLSLVQEYDKKTGSGNTGPYKEASHSNTLQAESDYNTVTNIIHLQFWKKTTKKTNKKQLQAMVIMSLLLQQYNVCIDFRQTHVSIIFLKSKTPAINLAANLQKIKNKK